MTPCVVRGRLGVTAIQLVFLNLAGGIALLLWGTHMVQSGVLRAFGSDLRRRLAASLDNRLKAFGEAKQHHLALLRGGGVAGHAWRDFYAGLT